MAGLYIAWASALVAAGTFVVLGMQLNLLARPRLYNRCAACRRFVRRGGVCRCAESGDSG